MFECISTTLDDIAEDTDTVIQGSDEQDWCDAQKYDAFPELEKEEATAEDQKKAEEHTFWHCSPGAHLLSMHGQPRFASPSLSGVPMPTRRFERLLGCSLLCECTMLKCKNHQFSNPAMPTYAKPTCTQTQDTPESQTDPNPTPSYSNPISTMLHPHPHPNPKPQVPNHNIHDQPI